MVSTEFKWVVVVLGTPKLLSVSCAHSPTLDGDSLLTPFAFPVAELKKKTKKLKNQREERLKKCCSFLALACFPEGAPNTPVTASPARVRESWGCTQHLPFQALKSTPCRAGDSAAHCASRKGPPPLIALVWNSELPGRARGEGTLVTSDASFLVPGPPGNHGFPCTVCVGVWSNVLPSANSPSAFSHR